ncbi:MAG: substrate-binding domain-containing protein [Thiotrichales bacterium]|nr:substrate-binding domain-containing protein [Thiotrichales bacterium]
MHFFTRLVLLLILIIPPLQAAERLRLATTTSTDNSGLLKVLHPPFEAQNDIRLDVIAVGTGKALRLAEQGDVDLVLVHAPAAERQFVDNGYGLERLAVMHNDFVILGPEDDPAGLGFLDDAARALIRMADAQEVFISRGDNSGTHKKELSLWRKQGREPGGDWYLSAGQGMGAVLKIADDKQAYTLTDRGTYLAYSDRISLAVLVEGDPDLFNPYHVIMVNPERHPHVNTEAAHKYIEYIRGAQGQSIIRDYRVGGATLFYPDVLP